MKNLLKLFAFLGFVFLVCLVGVGSVRAFTRGGNDFSVFYTAWELVLSGRGAEIYRVSPDRFLYGPGFAWLLSPMAFLSKRSALFVWSFSKVFLLGSLLHQLSRVWVKDLGRLAWGLSAWGVVLVARPLLIDFEYGQVNLWILAACTWALVAHFNTDSSRFRLFGSWALLACVAIAKLFPLPLLVVPWFVTRGIYAKKLQIEKLAILFGFFISFAVPFGSLGWEGMGDLIVGWRDALLARGLPLESHNQSFTAFLFHYLSGQPTFVLSAGPPTLFFGKAWLSGFQIQLFSLAWSFATCGILLGWVFSGGVQNEKSKWMATLLGLLIVPSHLVWKPYFVMSLPISILFVHQTLKGEGYFRWGLFFVLFVAINLTGFDFVGYQWAAHLEASSLLLGVHLLLLILVNRSRLIQR